ncbi:DNA polymerase III subunit beta [Thermus filiformis]|uniref:Beta sliding clamp n=1 Tax=Thermus filiformis TaxID=276 RepID=A0A0D6X9R4_THEFI|nr:DNA polymerase III subunit beta [Thermus filiformis]KIX84432.1 DNA polymerase III subunit beta [Thermus filiformis]
MKIQLDKKTLAEALALLERVIPSRSSNPLLTYLSLALPAAIPDGKGGALVLTGTNGEVDLRLFVLPSGREPVLGSGHVLIPAAPLAQVVRNLPGEEVLLEVEGELSLASASFQTRFAVADPEGFPEPLFPEPRLRLKAQDLLRALTHVRYAASNEEYRAIFRGIQLEFSEGGLRAVASDGYRLAVYDLKGAPVLERSAKLVVPARSVDEVVRVLKAVASPGDSDEVDLGFAEGTLGLSLAPKERPLGVRMAVRLMEGEFPDYERVIPKEYVLEAEVEADTLRESLKRVSVLADRQNHRVDLFFESASPLGEAREGRLTLSAEGDYGKGREELPVRASGVAMTVSFNARYLLDALGPLEGPVRLRLSGAQTPAVVSGGGEGEPDGYLAVVVPLRV